MTRLTGKRSERLLQREHDRVAIARVDRPTIRYAPLRGETNAGSSRLAKRVDHVGRRQLVAVVERTPRRSMAT